MRRFNIVKKPTDLNIQDLGYLGRLCCFFSFWGKRQADYKIYMKIQRIIAKYSLNKKNKIAGFIKRYYKAAAN